MGDGVFTELNGASRRYGLHTKARLSLTPWLSADTELNLSRGFLPNEPNDAAEIPLAPRLTSTGGLTFLHPDGYEGSPRYVHFGDCPTNEDSSVTAEGYTVFNLLAGYRFRVFKLMAVVENLFDVTWNKAQSNTEARLAGETESVSELHFTPGNPRNVRAGISYLL